eukprot:3649-Heterococcus_DN1.PRE.1
MQPVHGQVRPPTAVSTPLAAASSTPLTPTTVRAANITVPAASVAARVPRTVHTAAAAVAPPVERHNQVPQARVSQSVNASQNASSRETPANNGPFHAAHATEQAVAESARDATVIDCTMYHSASIALYTKCSYRSSNPLTVLVSELNGDVQVLVALTLVLTKSIISAA